MEDKKQMYRVLTWDMEIQKWTPQIGVRPGPYTLFGLRVPLRQLQARGYAGRPSEPSVLVEPIEPKG